MAATDLPAQLQDLLIHAFQPARPHLATELAPEALMSIELLSLEIAGTLSYLSAGTPPADSATRCERLSEAGGLLAQALASTSSAAVTRYVLQLELLRIWVIAQLQPSAAVPTS